MEFQVHIVKFSESPHCLLAVCSVYALKKKSFFLHSPGSVNGKETLLLGPSHRTLPANQQQFMLMRMTREGRRELRGKGAVRVRGGKSGTC